MYNNKEVIYMLYAIIILIVLFVAILSGVILFLIIGSAFYSVNKKLDKLDNKFINWIQSRRKINNN